MDTIEMSKIRDLLDISEGDGIKRSKKRDLMDISEGERHQNVQEEGFNGHFGG
ncbi:hypothetical protein M3204_01505 [Mesobacillus subterraneus]|uniref:hypothetical protein n=1 Tax=Mesobacillus subterraneus TaxID=285983 RepID=UPI0020413180|nr:hypothetical protein [Mesobacillus subterraneus]MCM3663062.1 hypothetical protein [Mesobacillus subterraneus]MCM3682762.1 hypothetical protein [Mesobacillus subterraneus]